MKVSHPKQYALVQKLSSLTGELLHARIPRLVARSRKISAKLATVIWCMASRNSRGGHAQAGTRCSARCWAAAARAAIPARLLAWASEAR